VAASRTQVAIVGAGPAGLLLQQLLRLQRAELDYLRGSRAAQTVLAENYAGLFA
jgi:cation diffusion facilitator CzcD-associated flavoprotein CzcO